MSRRERLLPDALTVAAALLLWAAFFPGLLSNDSIVQYGEALTGRYRDWHPPLMSILLHSVFALGGGLGALMLAQCLAGAFGVRALARSALELLHPGLPPGRIAWLSLGVLLVLLLPLSPLAFYLMTFWKDAWAMVFLLWIAALLLRRRPPAGSPGRLAAVAVLAAAFGLVRHNALVALPLIGQAFAVERCHPGSQVMVLDLVGLCAADRAACPRWLPWTWSHVLDAGSLAAYRPGDVGFIYWDRPPHVDAAMGDDFPRLRSEYLAAVRARPGLFARVKLAAFKTLLGRGQTEYFVQDSIAWNPYGLALRDSALTPLRRGLMRAASRVVWSRWLRWFSGAHLVWIAADLAWVAGLLAAWRRTREERYGLLAAVLLIPLAYYLSYLAATPGHDFRYMYPSTLAVQCVTLSWLLGALAAQKPAGRRP